MSSRGSFGTPTNVTPKNGQVLVFNEDNEAPLTFTNNTDSLSFIGLNITDVVDPYSEYMPLYDKIMKCFNMSRPVITHNRGDNITLWLDKYYSYTYYDPQQQKWFKDYYLNGDGEYAQRFYEGKHYTYNLSMYSCLASPIAGGYTLVPNNAVKFSTGRIQSVISDTEIQIEDGWSIVPPLYWTDDYVEEGVHYKGKVTQYPDVGQYLIYAIYIEIYGKQMMIVDYNSRTHVATLFEPITPIKMHDVPGGSISIDELETGMEYALYDNVISCAGGSSEGAYDFYIRHKVNSAAYANPVPGSYRCIATYQHPDNIGLEKYRFRIYQLIGDNNVEGESYINGTIQAPRDDNEENFGADYRHIPIEKNLNYEFENKRIIIGSKTDTGRITNGEWGEIINYDKHSGLLTLKKNLSIFPAEGRAYTIELCDRRFIADSGDCYSYHLAYNFPLYTFGQKFQIETIMTTYEKQVSDTCINIMVGEPELDYDYGQVGGNYSIEANPSNQTVELTFKPSIAEDDRFFGLYRRESGDENGVWHYLGFIREGNTYTDYLAANNTSYDYLISKTVKYIAHHFEDPNYDPLHEYDPDYSVEYKAHAFNNAVSTKWDGWTITALYPCENDYLSDTIQNHREDDGYLQQYEGSYKDTICNFVCVKTPYKVGDTWSFYAAIDSGDIISNLGRNVHVGTSTYPTVSGTNNKYQSGTFSTDIMTLECPTGLMYDNIEKVKKWLEFITDDCLFLLKSDKGDVWVVSISDNPSRSYDESVNDIITKVSYSWTEVDSVENIQIVEY